MKKLVGPMILLFGLSAALVALAWPHRAATDETARGTVTSRFAVEGMTCGGCEAGVELAVKRLDGVAQAHASYEEGTATVTYDPQRVTAGEIVAAIEALGYGAELIEDEAERDGDEGGS